MSEPETEFRDLEDLLGEAGGGEVELVESTVADPTQPFWRIPRRELQTVLKTAKEIAQRNTDQVSRSILLRQEAGGLQFFVTNKDIYYSGVLPLKNDQNILQGEMVLAAKQLDDIAKFSVDVVIYKEESQSFAALMRGVQPLDVYAFAPEIYKTPVVAVSSPFVDIDGAELKGQMELFVGLMSLASVAEDRKIVVKGAKAYGNFVSVAARADTLLPNMVVKSSDARDLLGVLTSASGTVRVQVSKDRVFFTTDKFSYSSFLLAASLSKELEDKFNAKGDAITVDGKHVFNLFSYMSVANSDAATAKMIPGVDGLKVSCKNKFGVTNSFIIGSESLPSLAFDLQIVPTRNIFRILYKYPTIHLSKPLEGFCKFDAGDPLVVLMGVRG